MTLFPVVWRALIVKWHNLAIEIHKISPLDTSELDDCVYEALECFGELINIIKWPGRS